MPKYPPHITDLKRVNMVAELLEKECVKLLPSLSLSEWKKVSSDIRSWFEGEKSDLAPVHDFWNLADGIMVGSKLKQLVRYFSAENISWSRIDVPVQDIDIVWPVGEFVGLELPYTQTTIKEYLAANPGVLEKNIDMSNTFEEKYKPREHYPVILVGKHSGRFDIGDGNRRVLRCMLQNKPKIPAWAGNYISGDEPINYWVSTGELRKLLYLAERANKDNKPEVIQSIREVLKEMFEISEIAKINWDLRCKDQSDFSRQLMS